MQPNTPDVSVLTPAVAAAFELHHLRGWHFADALEHLDDMLRNDCACPASALFTPAQVRSFYSERGRLVNVVAMPTGRGD